MKQRALAFVRSRKASLAACALAAVSLFTACLVTNKVDYDEAFIPSTVSRAGSRPGQFTSVPPEREEDCKKEGGWMGFTIKVSDLNREERLRLQIVVNRTYYDGRPIPPTGDLEREDVFFCVPRELLGMRCNLVEALVASSFNDRTSLPYDATNGDLASVNWWVLLDPERDPTASTLDCPEDVPDAGEL